MSMNLDVNVCTVGKIKSIDELTLADLGVSKSINKHGVTVYTDHNELTDFNVKDDSLSEFDILVLAGILMNRNVGEVVHNRISRMRFDELGNLDSLYPTDLLNEPLFFEESRFFDKSIKDDAIFDLHDAWLLFDRLLVALLIDKPEYRDQLNDKFDWCWVRPIMNCSFEN